MLKKKRGQAAPENGDKSNIRANLTPRFSSEALSLWLRLRDLYRLVTHPNPVLSPSTVLRVNSVEPLAIENHSSPFILPSIQKQKAVQQTAI